MKRLALILFAFMLVSPAAMAADTPDILTLPDGQALLHISATERQEVEQDLLVANLRYEAQNTDARTLQNEINEAMEKALKESGKVASVKAVTQQYYVHRRTDPRTKAESWQGNQSLMIKGKQADDVLELSGKLQDMGFIMGGLSYTLSPEKAEDIQDSLMEAALAKLKARADRAASALGKGTAELKEIQIQGNSPVYPVAYRSMARMEMAEAADMKAPSASPGETTLTLSVSAQALLKP